MMNEAVIRIVYTVDGDQSDHPARFLPLNVIRYYVLTIPG